MLEQMSVEKCEVPKMREEHFKRRKCTQCVQRSYLVFSFRRHIGTLVSWAMRDVWSRPITLLKAVAKDPI
jgi:hypothetical protein